MSQDFPCFIQSSTRLAGTFTRVDVTSRPVDRRIRCLTDTRQTCNSKSVDNGSLLPVGFFELQPCFVLGRTLMRCRSRCTAKPRRMESRPDIIQAVGIARMQPSSTVVGQYTFRGVTLSIGPRKSWRRMRDRPIEDLVVPRRTSGTNLARAKTIASRPRIQLTADVLGTKGRVCVEQAVNDQGGETEAESRDCSSRSTERNQ